MFNATDILETIRMIDQENLDVRTITMGISLLSCADRSTSGQIRPLRSPMIFTLLISFLRFLLPSLYPAGGGCTSSCQPHSVVIQ